MVWDQFADKIKHIRKGLVEAHNKRIEEIRNHEMNGTMGFWLVTGIRHKAIVKTDQADTAAEIAKEIVGDWALLAVDFIGTEFPDLFEI